MSGKSRVSAVAKELGITPQQAMAKLAELGEHVKSASSTIEAPVVRRLHEALDHPQKGEGPKESQTAPLRSYPKNPFGLGLPATAMGYARDLPDRAPAQFSGPRPSPRRWPRREWYRGPELSGFTRHLLDSLIIDRRNPPDPVPPERYRYWDDEVTEAKEYESAWATTQLDGLDWDDIVEWIVAFRAFGIGYSPRSITGIDVPAAAVRLQHADVHPSEIGWSWEDRGRGPLGERLVRGGWTVEQVITEIEGRHERAAHGSSTRGGA